VILAGDIGGTKVHLAAFEVEERGLTSVALATFASRDYPTLETIVQTFIETHQCSVDYGCFGIAGPVRQGRVQVTNLSWTVDARDLAAVVGAKQVWLINDLEANAHGIAGLAPEDFVELNHGNDGSVGNLAILSAGTGLGQAGLLWDGQRHAVIPSEGGHSDFAPRTDLDTELLRYLRSKLQQVSWENVLSGPGSLNIYEFLRDSGYGTEPAWLTEEFRRIDPPIAITRAALEGRCDLCVRTMNLFVDYYGAEASNLALKMLAVGGVYLGGGIAPRIIDLLKSGRFMNAFMGQGRMRELLSGIPVRVILNDKTALIGAARYAALQSGRML
jgi:glucokinase